MAHDYKPSAWEAGKQISDFVYKAKQSPGQSRLHTEILSWKTKQKKEKEIKKNNNKKIKIYTQHKQSSTKKTLIFYLFSLLICDMYMYSTS